MSFEDLVRTITREVLRQVQGSAGKREVLILSDRDCDSARSVLKHVALDSRVVFLDEEDPAAAPARMILPLLTCSQMSDLAAGKATDPVAEKVLSALLTGKTVEVFEFEYLRYRETAPAALLSLYESYDAKLCEFGLRQFSPGKICPIRPSRILVTEKDVKEAFRQGASEIEIFAETRLTPLAVDCARELGIQLNKSERRKI